MARRIGAAAALIDRDLGWRRLMDIRRGLRGGDHYAKVGVLAAAPVPDDEAPEFTMASLAAVHEFGSEDGRIPARPFIRGGIDAGRERIVGVAKVAVGKVYDGKLSVDRALNIIGMTGAAEIKKYVTEGEQVPPPNAPSTIRAKLKRGAWNDKRRKRGPVDSAKLIRTLIDTGRMIGSVTWVVVGGVSHTVATALTGGERRVS